MAVKDIIVPSMGESVSEATISKWFKKAGDAVKQDEPVAELETDKVTLEVNAPAGGVLKEIIAKEGSTVEVGALLGRIEEGATAAAAPAAKAAAPAPAASAPAPAAASSAPANASGPAARKIAEEAGVNLADVQGTGKDGRATKGDVLAHAAAPQAPKKTASSAGHEERVKMTKLRQTIAKRLKDSQNTAAILTTFNEIDMTNVIALRNEYKDAFEKKHGIRLGFMSFFVKAAVAALKEIPEVNASIEGDEIVYKRFFDIGVAVGGSQGLVVPVVRDADELSIAEIEAEIARLAGKAKDGTLAMSDMTGGTFTVSNGGVYGSLLSTPIINPPQSAILGMHKTEERPVAIKGQVVIRPMMYVALSYDHRIIDGRESVTFLVKIKEAVEDPRRLLLGV
ncbi:MAG TPA: 2-oxoglutarate dehydrogenase complex dihydrolipoyllysine-residue succinyltransferase [Rickettsiales bacterium]|nr:2-oxoglutarate dehydrogenase complex dihydrolipoyllysine-residue succinyltransferase [Rickettsiales bacterium]